MRSFPVFHVVTPRFQSKKSVQTSGQFPFRSDNGKGLARLVPFQSAVQPEFQSEFQAEFQAAFQPEFQISVFTK
jgi:hypothetical protein